jgi:MSHA type pilus biogenesis protein MshL
LVAGCATSTPSHDLRASVRVEPTTGPVAPAPAPAETRLPDLPAAVGEPGPVLAAAPERRLLEVNIPAGTPIATAVEQLGREYGLSVSVDPDVRGTTQANLRNVTLTEALRHVIPARVAQYEIRNGVLRVTPVRMIMRTFALDYVAISRVGTMNTVVQRRLSNTQPQSIPGLTPAINPPSIGATADADVLTAQSVADVWSDLRTALTGIWAAGAPRRAASPPPTPGTVEASIGAGPQATSTSFGDGSVLVVSPMAGLVSVTAYPDKIAAVERYLADFQASVLRQVVIAAKIVEVRLGKEAHFGIDWSLIAGSASSRFGVALRTDSATRVRGNTGNIAFTFNDGTTSINAVLSALESQGDVHVLSNEQTTALNNQRAIFQVTSDEVFFNVTRTPLLGPNGAVVSFQSSVTPQVVSVGVVLDVVPQISADNVLTMNIRPAVTSVTSVERIRLSDGTTASAPNIARREGDTVARLRVGETMMIGGLVQSRTDKSVSGVPVLKDIPFIGKAFQRVDDVESRSELVVFLTPTIIAGQTGAGR